MLLAGGGEEGVLDPDPNNPISLERQVRASGVSAEQVVTGGIPQRQSRLRIPFIGDVSVNGCSACRFEARVRNPFTDVEEFREIRIDSLAVDANNSTVLIALIAGPAPVGSVFTGTDSALSVGGKPIEAGSITFSGLALTPTEAALWFKAFEPTDAEMYPSGGFTAAVRRRNYPRNRPIPPWSFTKSVCKAGRFLVGFSVLLGCGTVHKNCLQAGQPSALF